MRATKACMVVLSAVVVVVGLSACAGNGDGENAWQPSGKLYRLVPPDELPRADLLAEDLEGEGLDPRDRKPVGGGGASVRGGVIERIRPDRMGPNPNAQRLRSQEQLLQSRGAVLDRRINQLNRDLQGSTLRRSATFQPNRARRAEQTRPRLELERRAVEGEVKAIQRSLDRATFENRTGQGGPRSGSALQGQLDRLRR